MTFDTQAARHTHTLRQRKRHTRIDRLQQFSMWSIFDKNSEKYWTKKRIIKIIFICSLYFFACSCFLCVLYIHTHSDTLRCRSPVCPSSTQALCPPSTWHATTRSRFCLPLLLLLLGSSHVALDNCFNMPADSAAKSRRRATQIEQFDNKIQLKMQKAINLLWSCSCRWCHMVAFATLNFNFNCSSNFRYALYGQHLSSLSESLLFLLLHCTIDSSVFNDRWSIEFFN